MKRFLFLLIAFCAFLTLNAQTKSDGPQSMTVEDFERMSVKEFNKYKFDKAWPEFPQFEVRVGFAGAPMLDILNFSDEKFVSDWGPSWSDVYSLDAIYAAQLGDTRMTGNIMAEFSWHVKKWFTLAGAVYINGLYSSTLDPSTGDILSRDRGASVALLPVARFYWANFEKCRLYSSVGLGVNFASYKGETSVLPTFQFSPIGFTAGRKFFVFAEYTFGFTNLGGQAGFGYRF